MRKHPDRNGERDGRWQSDRSSRPAARRVRAPPAGTAPQRRRWTGWGFVGPFLVVFAFALVAPIGYAIYLSLFRDQLIGGNAFVGFDNYRQALTDPQFWAALRRVALFLVVQVPVMLVLALLAALALDSARLRWAPLYRLSIFLPYAVPAVVGVADVGLHLRRRSSAWSPGSARRCTSACPTRFGQLGARRRSATSSPGSSSATTC